MLTFLLWCILLFFCWPVALVVLVLYPIVWLVLLPFRIMGIAVEGVLELLKAIILLPARLLRGPARTLCAPSHHRRDSDCSDSAIGLFDAHDCIRTIRQ